MSSCSLPQGIFPIQGLNLGLLHFRCILYCLSHQGNPLTPLVYVTQSNSLLSSLFIPSIASGWEALAFPLATCLAVPQDPVSCLLFLERALLRLLCCPLHISNPSMAAHPVPRLPLLRVVCTYSLGDYFLSQGHHPFLWASHSWVHVFSSDSSLQPHLCLTSAAFSAPLLHFCSSHHLSYSSTWQLWPLGLFSSHTLSDPPANPLDSSFKI